MVFPSCSSHALTLPPADGYLAPLHDTARTQLGSDDAAEPPSTPAQTFKRIPPRIIQNAAGIAIFTCMRSGLWMTGSGGSGIIIARKADGTWSPPSGIMLHTPTLSFIIGVDIYDCVLVINNMAALESLITRSKITLGEDIRLTQGPLIPLDSVEDDQRWREFDDTVLTYLKARGQAQVVNLHGCILTERGNENERFYSDCVSPSDILAGNVSRNVAETRPLFEVIKAAEGRIDADTAIINQLGAQPAPGDAMIASPRESPASPTTPFGLPCADDPDPFGILALEMAGLEIREAGTRLRPGSRQFEYSPGPASPAFSKFSRQSIQTLVSDSNRGSYMSTRTERTKMSDAYTQTDVNGTPGTTPSQCPSEDGISTDSIPVLKEPREEEEVDYTKIDLTPLRKISGTQSVDGATMTESATSADDQSRTDSSATDDAATKASSVYTKDDVVSTHEDEDDHDADDEDDMSDDDEEPVIYEIASVQPAARTAMVAAPVQVKGSLVNIPKRIPPPLPARSAARVSRARSEMGDVSHLHSPMSSTFSPSPRRSLDQAAAKTEIREIPSIREPSAEDSRENLEVPAIDAWTQKVPVLEVPSTENDREVGKTEDVHIADEKLSANLVAKLDDKEPTSEKSEEDSAVTPLAEVDNPSLALPSKMGPGAFPSDDDTELFVPPARNPKRTSKTEEKVEDTLLSKPIQSVA